MIEIGAWQQLDASRVQPYEEMRVWDGLGSGKIHFQPPVRIGESGDDAMAWMLENQNLHRALLRCLDSAASTTTLSPVSVERFAMEHTGNDTEREYIAWPVVRLSDGHTIMTRLLVRDHNLHSFALCHGDLRMACVPCRWVPMDGTRRCGGLPISMHMDGIIHSRQSWPR